MAKSVLVRLLFAVLLLGNAVSSGVCGMLCGAKACCPAQASNQSSKAMAKAPCCPRCKGNAEGGKPSIQKTDRPDCCAWIGTKADPPATTLKALVAHDGFAVAILPAPVRLPVLEAVLEPKLQVPTDGRAPPGRQVRVHNPRAPPIVSM